MSDNNKPQIENVVIKISRYVSSLDLTSSEKMILGKIQYFESEEDYAITNEQLCEEIGVSRRQIQRILMNLKTLGYITYELEENHKRRLKVTF